MKKKIALIALVILSVFSLILISSETNEVQACDAPLPHATVPQPCG